MQYLKIGFVVAFLLVSGNCKVLGQKQKPNVIVIYTDDQGAMDLGSYGAADLYTPSLDKLAKEGTRFTQSYVAAPICAPSRAALLTGRYPQGAGVEGNTSAAVGSHGMPHDQYTLAELFRDNGYHTAHIGKWHLGMSEKTGPNAQGFEYSFGHLRGCIDNYSHYFYWEGPNVHDLFENGKEVFYDGKYFPDLASEKALNYIQEHQNTPFFMFYAINMPHYPYQPTQKWRDYYKDLEDPRADYAAFISTIDERIGFLMDKLESLGIRENTVIVYQSDNGHSTEVRAFGGGGDAGPYRGAKFSLFEGGLRLPTIISWTGHLPQGEVNNQLMMAIDWMPTLANICKLDTIPDTFEGLDLSGMLLDPGTPSRRTDSFWKYGAQWAVRKGNWKLIGYPKDTSQKGHLDPESDALFLTDLEGDVSEMVNLAAKHPEKVDELTRHYLSWPYAKQEDIPGKAAEVEHKGVNAKISTIAPLHRDYQNITVLTDGKLGYKDFASGQWIGQEGKKLEVVLDLSRIDSVYGVSINYLYNDKSWILRPEEFAVSFSEDGRKYQSAKLKTLRTPLEANQIFTETADLTFDPVNARYVKVVIEPLQKCPDGFACQGNPAWFFIDEIILK